MLSGLMAALGGAVLLAVPGSARAADCPAAKSAPGFELILDVGKVTYDFTQSSEKLAVMRREAGDGDPAGRQAGMTRTRLGYEIHADIHVRGNPGAFCGHLQHVRVSVGWREIEVFVNRRYGESSCAHRATLAHENEHVLAHRAALRDAEPELGTRIGAAAATAPTLRAATVEEVRAAHLQRLEAVLKELAAAINRDAERRNAALDTAENYRVVSKRCARW